MDNIGVKPSNIIASIDGYSNVEQRYTFGQYIPNRWVAVGYGAVGYGGSNTIAHSSDGITWNGLGISIFTTAGYGVAWNGKLWVAVGQETNSIAYSSDGISWTGLGKTSFGTACYTFAWNGSTWMAGGEGGNTLAYSSDGISWTNQLTVGTKIQDIVWNGTIWVAACGGLYRSINGFSWIDATAGMGITNAVTRNGFRFIAVGNFGGTISRSNDGITWTSGVIGIGDNFGSVASNFNITPIPYIQHPTIAVGSGSVHTIAYSSDGISWRGLGTSIFSKGYSVAGNPTVGATVVDSQLVLGQNNFGLSNSLDIVSDNFYDPAYTKCTIRIKNS